MFFSANLCICGIVTGMSSKPYIYQEMYTFDLQSTPLLFLYIMHTACNTAEIKMFLYLHSDLPQVN